MNLDLLTENVNITPERFEQVDPLIYVGHYMWLLTSNRVPICELGLRRMLRIINWYKANAPDLFLYQVYFGGIIARDGTHQNVIDIVVTESGILPLRKVHITNRPIDQFSMCSYHSFHCHMKNLMGLNESPREYRFIDVMNDDEISRLIYTVRFISA